MIESLRSLSDFIVLHEGIKNYDIENDVDETIFEDNELSNIQFLHELSTEPHEEKMPFQCKECQAGFEEESHLTGYYAHS